MSLQGWQRAVRNLDPASGISVFCADLEVSFWRSHSFQIEASKHRPVYCLFLPEGGLLVPPPANPASQPGGKAVLGDLFSGAVSKELRPSPETHKHRGRQTHMHKSLLSRRALVNLTLSAKFLVPMETPLCANLCTQHRGTESLILCVQL